MFDRCRDRGPAPPGGCPAEEGHGQGPALRRAARAGREVPGRGALTEAGRQQIAADIEKLLDLGKTDAWKGAIKDWAGAVRDEDKRLNWAYCQYGICAGHAA